MTHRGAILTAALLALAVLASVARVTVDDERPSAPTATAETKSATPAPDTVPLAGSDPDTAKARAITAPARAPVDAPRVARAFGERFTNWTAKEAARTFATLAADSAGPARAQLREMAATARTNRALRNVANAGEVQAIDRRPDGRLVVVISEHGLLDGQPVAGSERVAIYQATVQRVGGRSRVTRWEPQR